MKRGLIYGSACGWFGSDVSEKTLVGAFQKGQNGNQVTNL